MAMPCIHLQLEIANKNFTSKCSGHQVLIAVGVFIVLDSIFIITF